MPGLNLNCADYDAEYEGTAIDDDVELLDEVELDDSGEHEVAPVDPAPANDNENRFAVVLASAAVFDRCEKRHDAADVLDDIEVVETDESEDEPDIPNAPRDNTSLNKQADAILEANPLPKEPVNDNWRRKESWPLRDAITKGHLGELADEKAKLSKAAHRIRYLVDESDRDVIGLSVHLAGKPTPTDYAVQKDKCGTVVFANGQTLDRKSQLKERSNGETDKTYDGAVRTAGKSGPVNNSGFDPGRDEPIALRKVYARQELDEIQAAVGPLWEHIEQAVCNNVTATRVGEVLGYKGTQAPAAGTAVLRIGLLAAARAIDRCTTIRNDAAYLSWLEMQHDCTPVPARRLKRALLRQLPGPRMVSL